MKQTQSQFEILDLAHKYSKEYLNDNNKTHVFPSQSALNALQVFEEELPKVGIKASEMLSMLNTFGAPATVRYGSGRYFGFVNGGVFPAALAARWIADTWDQNGALHLMSPVVSKLETVCENWLIKIFNLPKDAACGFVSGTSAASIVALTAARDHLLARKGWDVDSNGLFGAPEIKVIVSNNSHSSIYKALSIVGLGRDRVIKVPTDIYGRMITSKIPELDDMTILICQAGEVNTGAFDDFNAICSLAKSANAWVHVDGAFGLWAAASKQTYHLYKGAEYADSWAADAHKTLNAPYDTGVVLCRHKPALMNSMRSSGAYLEFTNTRDGMLFGPEMSRRARVIDIWSVLKTLGSTGLEELINNLCKYAKCLASMLADSGFIVLNEVCFNQVLFACKTSDETTRLLSHIQSSGQIWCGGTTWYNKPAIRMSICDFSTTQENISFAVNVLVESLLSIQKELEHV